MKTIYVKASCVITTYKTHICVHISEPNVETLTDNKIDALDSLITINKVIHGSSTTYYNHNWFCFILVNRCFMLLNECKKYSLQLTALSVIYMH